ncbi:O-antigen ligase family protein [Halochromatium roseum]|uniref:O-antigen ligase family protein n=1 Tax=Halochromatium roseum TaxID=391920 RepID=UPI0019139F14
MRISLRQVIAVVIFFWVLALFYEALTAPPRLYVDGVLVEIERSRSMMLAVAALFGATALLILVRMFSQTISVIKGSIANFLIIVLALAIFIINLIQLNLEASGYSIIFLVFVLVAMHANRVFSCQHYFALSSALIAILLVLVMVHGFPDGRWIGGLHPGFTGAFALAATYFAARSSSNLRWVMYAIAFFFSAIVSSRYAIVAITLVIISDALAVNLRLSMTKLLLLMISFSAVVFILAIGFDYFLQTLLQTDDPSRGIGSGFSGRLDMYSDFYPQINQRPLFGYGFRNRNAYFPTHNGILDYMLENGVLLFALFFVIILARLLQCVVRVRHEWNRRDLLRIGCWCAWLFSGFFIPQLINFGDAFALMTIFLLTDDGTPVPNTIVTT